MVDAAYLDALRAIAQPIRATEMPRSLVPMHRLLHELNDPQKQFPSVVVTGSVGKGTTSHKLARIIKSATSIGRVGLFTGPHLHSFRERFKINGEMITQPAFVESMDAVQKAVANLDFAYSTFEMATALTLWWFAQQKVDIAILEVGIGGRWDAVNAVANILAVFTPIEAEHVAMLGGSLQTIAWNKVGIIQPNGWAVSIRQSSVVEDVLTLEADQKAAVLRLAKPGHFMRTACYVLSERQFIPPLAELTEWLVHQPENLPGRSEVHEMNGRKMIIDGAHTLNAANYLREFLSEIAGSYNQPTHLIVGMFKDKSARDFLAVFDSPNFHITLTTSPGHRALSPETLAAQANLQSARVDVVADLSTALKQAETASEKVVVIAGSLRMAATAREYYGLLSPDELEESRATRAIFDGDDYLSKLSGKK